MFLNFSRSLMPAVMVVLLGTTAARADWSYAWSNASVAVFPTGGTLGGEVFLFPPAGGPGSSPITPIGLQATTSVQNGNDLYDHAGYSFDFTITDDAVGQSHLLQPVNGELNGSVTSNLASLTNAFLNGSGSQEFDFFGHHYAVTFGFTAQDAAPADWAGSITASVAVTDIPTDGPPPPPPVTESPEPATLILAALALPCFGLAGRRLRGSRAARPE